MNNNNFPTIWDILFFVGGICALTYTFYMSWFRPAKFLKRSVKAVKDYWPFAQYFRSYYASSTWLWLMRIGSTFFLLVILFIAYNVILSLLNKIP